ncbi:universal stress protein [Streptomyces sp. NPDC058690]|uniref:universal stress protein n=1 Tax=Streptomyces sp. NPDC058690 TaxID=3346600 RepID=UPI003655591E
MTSNVDPSAELLVGVDLNRPFDLPLAWAADEAHRRGLTVRLLLAVPPSHHGHHVDSTAQHLALRAQGSDSLAQAAARIHERHGDLEVVTELLDGMPAPLLCRNSLQARMIVLGTRGLGRLAEFLSAGSVTVPVSAQAPCPVVVVREPEHITQQPPHVVVGVDGSPASDAAVAFAFEEAALRGAELRALLVRQPSMVSFRESASAEPERLKLLSEAIAGPSAEYPDVHVTHEVARGHPVEELARASEGALAVVVGRRGRGGYTGMRLGSVVHGLLHRAHCPVITVPAPSTVPAA